MVGETGADHIEIGGAAPCFIVPDVPATLAFYHDKLGFDITYQGPDPEDIFFGIVQRVHAMLMFKAVGIDAVPNHTRNIGRGVMRWDAYLYAPDPDALYEEFSSKDIEFAVALGNNSDNLRGFEVRDPNGYILFFGRPNS